MFLYYEAVYPTIVATKGHCSCADVVRWKDDSICKGRTVALKADVTSHRLFVKSSILRLTLESCELAQHSQKVAAEYRRSKAAPKRPRRQTTHLL